jgi:hypothetical protein
LCMAVLLAGSSISKARQVFLHMGLGCVSLNTYFRYQRVCIYRTFTKNFRKGSHIELITLTLHVAPPPLKTLCDWGWINCMFCVQ